MDTAARQAHGDVSACDRRPHPRRRASMVLLAAGAVGLIGAGAVASWTATADVDTGALKGASTAVALTPVGSRFSVDTEDLLPGDFFYRYVDLVNKGTSSGIFTGTIKIDAPFAGSLTAQVDKCSEAWIGPSCAGTTTPLQAKATIPDGGLDVTYGSVLPSGDDPGVAHLRYRFLLPDNAPATIQNVARPIKITVTGESLGGRDRTAG